MLGHLQRVLDHFPTHVRVVLQHVFENFPIRVRKIPNKCSRNSQQGVEIKGLVKKGPRVPFNISFLRWENIEGSSNPLNPQCTLHTQERLRSKAGIQTTITPPHSRQGARVPFNFSLQDKTPRGVTLPALSHHLSRQPCTGTPREDKQRAPA